MGALFPKLTSFVVPIMADAALKGVVLLAAAGLATLAMQRASAAMRHLVWTLAVVGLLALPVLSALLPQWQVLPQWPYLDATAPPSAGVAQPPAPVPPKAGAVGNGLLVFSQARAPVPHTALHSGLRP